jgi:hypothetical protein
VLHRFFSLIRTSLVESAKAVDELLISFFRALGISGDDLASAVFTLSRALRLTPFGVFVEVAAPRRDLREENLKRAVAALEEASALVGALDEDLRNRMVQLERLRGDYEHYSQLAALEEEKAAAVLEEVQKTVGRGRKREWVIAAIINLSTGILLFFLGIVVQRTWLS